MRLLDGRELAGFIKERHASQVRTLRAAKVYPKLAIIQLKDDPVINTYVRLKKQYGADISIEVEIHTPPIEKVAELIKQLNEDGKIHGIIVQLPLPDVTKTDEIVNLVSPSKDVDALGKKANFEPATPMAILWLLAGYNIELKGRRVLIIGKGRLVGQPLEKILRKSGVSVKVATRSTKGLEELAKEADAIISAANEPKVLNSGMIKKGAVVVDAGVAGESGKTVGNVTDDVYSRDDLIITPQKGGVGPLTVCALFENVIRASQAKVVNG